MFYAYAAMILSVSSLFMPAPGPIVCLVLALVSGVLYVRAMRRKAIREGSDR